MSRPHTSRKPLKYVATAALPVIGALAFTTATATPAAAGDCTYGYPPCSEVYNETNQFQTNPRSVRIANNWCDPNNGTYVGASLPCTASYLWLPPGGYSGSYSGFRDADAFQAPAGCITIFTGVGLGGGYQTADRRGQAAQWYKVSNLDTARIRTINCY
jgi:hypothetical protein